MDIECSPDSKTVEYLGSASENEASMLCICRYNQDVSAAMFVVTKCTLRAFFTSSSVRGQTDASTFANELPGPFSAHLHFEIV